MINNLEEGSIVEGKVTKIKPFGALVQLPGNIQGLVHISHVSSEYVQNVNEYVSVGDVIKVKILSVDAKANKVSLSIKEANAPTAPEPPKKEYEKPRQNNSVDANSSFEDKFKEYVKLSNERLAGLNKRNKRR